MISVLAGILKFILIFLLAALLLLLLLVLLLLFSPIGYKLRGTFLEERADGTAKASALFGVVSGEICYHHGIAVSGSLRLFGIKLFGIEGRKEDDDGDDKGAV